MNMPDFRHKRPPQAAPAAAVSTVEGDPTGAVLPPPGGIFRKGEVYISDSTRRQLNAVGWQEGDPIPKDLSDRLAEFNKQLDQEDAQRQASRPTESPPPPRPTSIRDITELTPEQQAEIRDLLKQAKEVEAAENARFSREAAAQEAIPAGAHPSIAAAIQGAQRVGQASQAVEVIDDRQTAPAQPQAAPATTPAVAQNLPNDSQLPPEHSHAGGDLQITHCPRCAWDLGIKFDVEATTEDITKYVAAMLGPTRFTKTVSLMGGALQVTYRSLTASEARLVMDQLGHDLKQGKIHNQALFIQALQDYRLLLSVERLARADGTTISQLPELSDIPYDPPADGTLQTVLVPLSQYFDEHVLPHESLRRVVGQHHRQFQRLVELLEAKVGEPNFYEGIAPQP